ncbi:MAG: GH3 auxin-responsive promoter family protein [Nitrososphaeria archaeon]
MDNEELWKHCDFFKKSFDEQLAFGEEKLKKHLEAWNTTKTAKSICKDREIKTVNDIPVTEYEEYTFLSTFRDTIEDRVKTEPRGSGELWHDYYIRILGSISYTVEGYLPDKPSICIKTTGTTGKNKFVPHGVKFNEQFISDTVSIILFGTAKEWGEKVFDPKPNAFNLVAPVPYLSGWALRYWESLINFIPPISFTDFTNDMGKKFYKALKLIENGNKIQIVGGSGALLYMTCKYFSDPEYFMTESYKMTPIWWKRMLILLNLLVTKISRKRVKDLKEIMPLKGVIIGSTDARIYSDFFKKEFGVEPINSYSTTEIGCAMFGRPDRKLDFFPNLRSVYPEFLDEKGEIRKLYELKLGDIYELIATPYYSTFTRYRVRDMFKVEDFYDGCPVFTFEGRTQNILDVLNYYRFSEDLMAKVLADVGFVSSDRWVVSKTEPSQRLDIYFEKEWPVTPNQAERLIFDSMLKLVPGFDNYIKDFNIRNPSDVIRVNFLSRGTFTRYTIKQVRKNMPLGQYKPPKVVPPNKGYVIEELKECSRNA